MLKVKISMGSTYCGCPSEEVEIEYDGTEDEFNKDHYMSTEILNMIFNNEFPHYFMDMECEEFEDDDEEEEEDIEE